ncbi:hypothetical protein RUM44_012497 [Polyplax serrata]|uniref:C2HC/C3H-type domain-containing protein n=1 Tax=Polyplax serrata TaxID=468196 RepID=A0ABR1BBH2_POLSC
MNNSMRKFMTSRDLKECAICGRRFTEDRLKIHEAVCQAVTAKKRKLFDAARQRICGMEYEKNTKAGVSKPKEGKLNAKGPSVLSTNWRLRHDEFLTIMKKSKSRETEDKSCGNSSDFQLGPILDCDNSVRCPHCLRNFNPSAAERHVLQCEKMSAKEKKSEMSAPSLSNAVA